MEFVLYFTFLALLFFGGVCLFMLIRYLISRINRNKNKKNIKEKVKVNKSYIRFTAYFAIIGIVGFFIVYIIILNKSIVIQ